MNIPKTPSWPIVIASGLTGWAVKWALDSSILGIVVFAGMGALLMLLSNRRRRVVAR